MPALDKTPNSILFQATLGSELAPAYSGNSGVNWTFSNTAGYVEPIAGSIQKTGDGTGTITPTAATNIEANVMYLVTHVITSISGGTLAMTLGGNTLTPLSSAGTFQEFVFTNATTKPLLTPSATGLRINFTTSWKKLTDLTGDVTVQGDLFITCIKAIGGADGTGIYISKAGNVGIGKVPSGGSTIRLQLTGSVSADTAILAPLGQFTTIYPLVDGDLVMQTRDTSAITTKAIIFKVGKGGTTRLEVLRISDAGHISHTAGLYQFFDASPTSDTIGDTKRSNQGGWEYIETCMVASATKNDTTAGHWILTEARKTISLVDNNMQYTGVVPQTANSFIALPTGKSGFGRIIIGDAQEYSDFVFKADGTVTLINNSANVVTTETDAKLCITDGGSLVFIVNELGSTLTATIRINCNS